MAYNEYHTAYHFINTYGWDKFQLFCKMMNDGAKLREMVPFFGISIAQLSIYRDKMFVQQYIPKSGTASAIEEFAYRDKMRSDQKIAHLTLISRGTK